MRPAMLNISLESIPEDILLILLERQEELKQKKIIKSLEEIYLAYISEQLQGMKGKVTKAYPKL